MFDSLTIVRQLTEAGIDRAHADAIADGIRQAAEHGEHVTPEALRAEIAGVLTAISAAETRLTWRVARRRPARDSRATAARLALPKVAT